MFEYGFGVHPCFFFKSSGKFTTMISSRTFSFFLYFPFGISTYSSLLVVIVSISCSLFDPSCSSRSFLLQHVSCGVEIIKFLKLCLPFGKLITRLTGAHLSGPGLDAFPRRSLLQSLLYFRLLHSMYSSGYVSFLQPGIL